MRRCYGCMQEFADEFELCPHCGFIVGTAQEVKSHLPCGTKLSGGRYVVGKVLGYGGFGITYIAWDSKRNRPVAVKEFFPNALSTRSEGETVVSCYNSKSEKFFKEGVRKMLDEGERLSKFHKNESIVNVYDYFEANKTAYIVMEYLEGKDLKKYLEENGGKLDADEAIEIMLPVLNALNDMHKESLIHRDISPDNIFICNNGKVKILDFGSARLAVADADKSMSIMLKKGYAPKEQYSSHSKQGPWTDVYAASATLYELVTGHKPVDSMDRDEEPLKTFKELGVLGMGELEAVILKGMAQDVAERTPDAATLYAQLAELIKPTDGMKPDFTPKPPQPKAPPKTKKSKKPLIIAAVIAVVIAVGAVGGKFAWDRFSSKTEESTTTTAPVTETTTEVTTAEVTTEAPMLSDAVPYEFKNGEKTVTEKLNTILGENENVFMADINGDKNSEIIVIKESETPDETGKKPTEVYAYTTLADGTMVETKLFCDSSSQFLVDTTDNALYAVDKIQNREEGMLYTATKYTVSETGFNFLDKISVTEPEEKEGLNTGAIINAVEKEFNEKFKTLCAPAEPEKLIDISSEKSNHKGEFGSSVKWIYHEHGKLLRIMGSGHMLEDFEGGYPWEDYYNKFEYVIIGDSVLSINPYCFSYEKLLKDVYIGENVTEIGSCAFEGCKNLTELKIPDNVTQINYGAIGDSGVKNLYIGKSVKTIYTDNYDGDNEICNVYSENLEKIIVSPQNSHFESDKNGILYDKGMRRLVCFPASNPLKSFTLDKKTKNIRDHAFSYVKKLAEINLHEDVYYIGAWAFEGCESLSKIKIPGNIECILSGSFYGCSKLKSVEIGNGITEIGYAAFDGCSSLENVVLPSTLDYIDVNAFYGCSSLKSINLPESLWGIYEYAFGYCTSLSSIIVPYNVTWVGDCAFKGCSNLTITVDRYQKDCDYSEEWYGDATVIYKEEATNPLFPFLF